ncbi:MAG: hypothetical protein ACRELB_01140 [Polyangiaceae bacterium]
MSSESNGHKPDSQEPGPSSGTATRQSGRAPSAWGATRDALAAVHNLEALLRSSSVLYRTIRDLLPELQASAGTLREAFERARALGGAAHDVGLYGAGRVADLSRLLDAVALADEERDELADRTRRLADEIDATSELLGLLERASDPAPTEVSVDRVVREALRLAGSGRGHELRLRFDEAAPDCAVVADPYLLGPLLSLLVGAVHAAGCASIVVRARCVEEEAAFTVEAAGAGDEAHAALAMRALPSVPPTVGTMRRVAESIGATLDFQGTRGSLRLRCPVG